MIIRLYLMIFLVNENPCTFSFLNEGVWGPRALGSDALMSMRDLGLAHRWETCRLVCFQLPRPLLWRLYAQMVHGQGEWRPWPPGRGKSAGLVMARVLRFFFSPTG